MKDLYITKSKPDSENDEPFYPIDIQDIDWLENMEDLCLGNDPCTFL